jgi:hypothetical protein
MFRMMQWIRKLFGHDKYSAETFDRLLWSTHVEDLRWVVRMTTGGAVLLIFIIIVAWHQELITEFREALVPFGAVLAALGGIIAWCYKTGNARLGIVDLFACEITTLCRICTVVGLADTCISAHEMGAHEGRPADREKFASSREPFIHFASSEHYTPVFDANAKELQVLNVKALTNITAFYTYWKAIRDAFRKLAAIPAPVSTPSATEMDPWHRAMLYVIYMQFLAFESARKAVRDLIEFEPNRAENTIVILLSELPAYHFLLKHFPQGSVHRKRLELRRQLYASAVAGVYYQTEDAYKKYFDNDFVRRNLRHLKRKELEELRRDWAKAHELLQDVKGRYEALGEFPSRRAESDE